MRHQRQLAELVRSPKLEEVGLEALRDDEGRTTDEHFLRLYQRYSLGKLPSILTRVSMERIHPGVFSRAANGNVLHFDFESDPKHVEWMSYDIRRGFRPPLYLYRGIFGKTIGAFVCSDDVAAYCAYRKLGIRQVPALILGRSADMLEESGICLRIQGGKTVFDSVIAAKRTRAATLFGDNSRLNKLSPIAAIKRLRLEADRAAAGIRAFHIESDSADEIHYHHCLHSIALRLSEVLQAVELLLRNNLAYQMRPLIRSTYELFLNFYIDWLSPEHVGLLLQGMAVLSRTEKARSDHQQLKQSMETTFGGLMGVCRNASEKGRLSPLGAEVHSKIYSSLSPIVHQDFGVTHEYSGALTSGRAERMCRSEIMANIRWLDLITAAAVARLMDDVGVGDGKSKVWANLRPSPLRRVGIRRPSC